MRTMSGNSATAEADVLADVLIVGGGMVGGTLACALAGAGVTVAVVDPEPASVQTDAAFDGRASAIAAGSQQILAAIGLWHDLAEDAQPILEIRVSDGRSPLFLHYDNAEIGVGPLGYMVENRALRRAVFKRQADLSKLVLIEGRKVVSVARGPARVAAVLDDGSRVRATLAVAADGRRSAVRAGAGIPVTEWGYRQTGIVCTVAHERPHDGIAQEHFLPSGPFAILPLRGNRSSIVWTERADLAPLMMALPDAEFAAEMAQRFGDYLGALEVIGPRFSYPLALSHADSYIAPRLALVGDAAHGMHPIAGQGFNFGLRDVAALGEVVVDASRLGLDIGSMAVLTRYQGWRRFDNSLMLALTDGINRLFSNDIEPVRLARDVGLATVNRLPTVKRVLMRHAMGLAGDLPRLARGHPL